VPSVALGSGSVTLERLTAAYGAFANRGVVPEPSYIRRVTDTKGRVLFDAEVTAESRPVVISPATAFIMASLLRGVVDAGTGARVRQEGFTAPAAGKTGTTDDYKDAWFIGFTPALAAGVWIGFDEPRTIAPRGYASDLAAPIWASFMREVVDPGRADTWIERPADVVSVEICALSGSVATDACRRRDGDMLGRTRHPSTYVEFFAVGTEPVDLCSLHQDRSFLAFLTAPFRLPSASDRPRSAPRPAAAETAPRIVGTARAESASVAVIHDHVFGNCRGRLVAGSDGLRYVTAHKDAFAITLEDIVRARVDVESGRLQVAVRRGRVYNFEAAAADRDALTALTRSVGQSDSWSQERR